MAIKFLHDGHYTGSNSDLTIDGTLTVGSNTVINTARQGFFASLQHSGTISFLNGSQGTTGSAAQGINVGAVFASGSYNNTPGVGDIWATSDMRAPIFYDYDNINYYVDPNAQSVLDKLQVKGRTLHGLTSTSFGNPKTEIAGFIAVPGPETTRNFVLPGITENKLAGAHIRSGYTVSVTKDGSTLNNNLANAFLANDSFASVTSTTSSTVVIITISHPGFTHGSNFGITFSNPAWRAKDVKIERSTDSGSSYTTIYNVTDSARSAHIQYSSTGSTATNQIRITLTNFNTTSTRISHIIGNNYAGGAGYFSQLYADNALHGNQTIQSGFSMSSPLYYETGSTVNYLDLSNTSTSLKVAGSLDIDGTGNNNFVGNIVIDNAAPILQANSSNAASGFRINVTGLDQNGDDLLRIQDAGTTRVELHKDGTFQGLTSTSFVKSGGTSSQFLMADGSVSTGGGSIDGSGTANDVVMWSDSDTLTDAPIAISGNNASFAGNITVAFDSNNSGNRLRIADTEGASAAVRTYSTSDGTGLILNHYYAVSGSPYMRYSDFVSNMGDAAATTMRFLTKPHNGNPTVALTIDNSQNSTFSGAVTASNFILTGTDGFNLPSGGFVDWANGDARIVEGLVNNYSLSFQTYNGSAITTALRLDGDNTATFEADLQADNIGLGAPAESFGTGVPTLLLKGTNSTNGRAGALYFKENDGTETAALYVTDGADGYGTVLTAYQGSIKLATGSLTGTVLTLDQSNNATFEGDVNINGGDLTVGNASNNGTVTIRSLDSSSSTRTAKLKFNIAGTDVSDLTLHNNTSGIATNTLVYSVGGSAKVNFFADGNVSNVGHTTSTKFRDADNTAYYLDPDSSTISLDVKGRITRGSKTFGGGNGVHADSRLGIVNNGSLTSIVNASTYNDANYPDYGLVFIQGPSTSSYNVWSISPDGPAKGSDLNFIYQAQATNIHTQTPMLKLHGSTGNATFSGKVGMENGFATSKFAVKSSDVHGSYDFYNNGTSYFNGDVIIDANITQTTGTTATFSGDVTFQGGEGAVQVIGSGNQDIKVGSTSSGYARIYFDGSNGDFSGSDYLYIGQDDDKSVHFNVGSSGGTTTFTSKGSTNLVLDGTTSTFSANLVINGSGSSGNAFYVTSGTNGDVNLRVQNSGEVVVQNNYLYASGAGVSMYVQNTAVFRGAIMNDTANSAVRFSDDVSIDSGKILMVDEIRDKGGQDLTITAGEASGHLDQSTHDDEHIRLAAEAGVKVYASTDNLTSGLNKVTTLIDSSGHMNVSNSLTVNGISSSINTGNSGTIVTNDANNYPRITVSNASAQLGLFRSTSAVGGMYIGGNDTGFRIYSESFNERLHCDASGNLRFDGDLTVDGGDISLGGTGRIQGVDTVSAGTDAANKTYVDNSVSGLATADTTYEFNFSTQLSANTWTDTGIDGTDMETGTYIMRVEVDDHNIGGGHYSEAYSATINWFAGGTNSTKHDEIPVHRSGHAPNNSDLQFRTLRHSSGDDDLVLQVKINTAYSAAPNNTDDGKKFKFKFRKMI